MFNYLPVRVKKNKNESNELYYQMLSNKRSALDFNGRGQPLADDEAQILLELLS